MWHKCKRKDLMKSDPQVTPKLQLTDKDFKIEIQNIEKNICLINKKVLNRNYRNNRIEKSELKHSIPKIKN